MLLGGQGLPVIKLAFMASTPCHAGTLPCHAVGLRKLCGSLASTTQLTRAHSPELPQWARWGEA